MALTIELSELVQRWNGTITVVSAGNPTIDPKRPSQYVFNQDINKALSRIYSKFRIDGISETKEETEVRVERLQEKISFITMIEYLRRGEWQGVLEEQEVVPCFRYMDKQVVDCQAEAL